MSNPPKFSLSQIQATLPAVNPKADHLQGLIASRLTDERLGNIVDKLLDKADKGDIKALDYLLRLGGMQQQAPQTVIVQQFVEGPRAVASHETQAPPQRTPLQIVSGYLAAMGEATPELIASQVSLSVEDVISCLDDHPEVFNVTGNTYSLKSHQKRRRA